MRTWYLPAVALALCATTLPAQNLDFTHPAAPDTSRARIIPEAVLQKAITSYNTSKTRVPSKLPSIADIDGSLGVFGDVNITGRVGGDVVVINGNARIWASARVQGRITVLGGHLTIDPGASVGATEAYDAPALVDLQNDGTLKIRSKPHSLGNYMSRSFSAGSVDFMGRLSLGSYNRVEGFAPRIQPSIVWHADSERTVRLDLTGIARTATDPFSKRATFGGDIKLAAHTTAPMPITAGIRAGNVISPTADHPLPELEADLNTLFLRRDTRDWYKNEYWGAFGDWSIRPELTLSGAFTFSKESGIGAADVFSIVNSATPWRNNPLIDDGNFLNVSIGAEYDTRDHAVRPRSGLDARLVLTRTSSGSMTPVTLPLSIRPEMPSSQYAATELEFDIRQYTRLTPTQSLHFRLSGGGHIAGDPLTLQRRKAMGGGDLLSGYQFRAINCDLRKAEDPSMPALCDRQLIAQMEYRKELDIHYGTRIGPYPIGFQRPEFVAFGDGGSAWLAGNLVGQVPASRIQTIGEWHYDVGVGIDAGLFGIYLVKAITDHQPARLLLRFNPRF